MVGELFGRWLAAVILGGLLLGSIIGTLSFCGTHLLGQQDADGLSRMVMLQLAGWLVAGFFAVVRFLSYLDLRIRREGWEVELLMRAEEARLQRQWK